MVSLSSSFCTVVLCSIFYVLLGSEDFNTVVRRKQPGLNAPNKLWWAKEVTPDYHIAGRLTERQIKYASEGGFRSILSLFIYETDDVGDFGGEKLPNSAEAWAVSHLAGLQYVALIGANDDWASVETIQKFAAVIDNLRKPVLMHCDRGYTITFVTLMYMANQTRYNSSFEPKVYSKDFYRITAAMGLDFTSDDLKEIVANITGEEFVKDPPKSNCDPSEWLDFWLAHPVSRNWYTAGQIRKCDIKVLEATGFKAIVNMRLGVVTNKTYTQEPVNLLNIKDGTSTYGYKSVLPRQDLNTLEKNRINAHLSSDYISSHSRRNFEAENSLEFGDDIGYNEHLEEDVVKLSNMKYYHVPVCKCQKKHEILSWFNTFRVV